MPMRKLVKTSKYPNGVDCVHWHIHNKPTPESNGNSSAVLPDEAGYAGVYDFYVSHDEGIPVSFEYKGHNVIFEARIPTHTPCTISKLK